MRRHLAYLAASVVLALPLAACGSEPADTDLDGIEVEVMDCEDKRKKEVPDCGLRRNGKYVEWSWVKAGKKTPPAGWSPRHESTGSSPKPTPRASTRTTSGGGTNLLDGRSRRATTNGNNSGTGTNRSNGGTNRRS